MVQQGMKRNHRNRVVFTPCNQGSARISSSADTARTDGPTPLPRWTWLCDMSFPLLGNELESAPYRVKTPSRTDRTRKTRVLSDTLPASALATRLISQELEAGMLTSQVGNKHLILW